MIEWKQKKSAGARCELITSIVLAGGKSSRLGINKATVPIGDSTLLQRVIERLDALSIEIIIVTGADSVDLGSFRSTKSRVVSDVFPHRGSLGGLFSGLQAANTSYSLAVACDMPFLNQALLRHLISLSPGFDVVVPQVEGKAEPLHAIYSKDCLGPMAESLKRGEQRIVGFFPQVRARYVAEEELRRFDAELLSFFNINTPADLERAQALEAKLRGRDQLEKYVKPSEEVPIES